MYFIHYPRCYISKNFVLRLYSGFPNKKIVLHFIVDVEIRAHSHLMTVTQIFDVVSILSEMGYIVTNVTVHT